MRAIRSASAYFLHIVERRARDDQRRSRLVDQDAVHLIDDGVEELSLALVVLDRLHVVAQVIEAELVVGAVGDIAGVDFLALGRFHLRLDCPDGHSQALEEGAHPLGVAAREVVVDRDHVHALAFQSVQISGQGRDQRLALARDHLGDIAAVQDHAAHELNIEMAHVQEPPTRLPTGRERLGQEVVERLSRGPTAPELHGLGLELKCRKVPASGARGR